MSIETDEVKAVKGLDLEKGELQALVQSLDLVVRNEGLSAASIVLPLARKIQEHTSEKFPETPK